MTLTGKAYRVIFKELKEQQECEFEKAFNAGIQQLKNHQHQTREAIQVTAEMFQAESLSLLSQKFEAVERLLRLELGHESFRALLIAYHDALRNAILHKVSA